MGSISLIASVLYNIQSFSTSSRNSAGSRPFSLVKMRNDYGKFLCYALAGKGPLRFFGRNISLSFLIYRLDCLSKSSAFVIFPDNQPQLS